MNYTEENRGKPQFINRMKQAISFEGMDFGGNITPTDVDGFFEVHGEVFVFFEMKLEGAVMSKGQRLALTRNVDYLQMAGREAALFVCTHNVRDVTRTIMAKDTNVQKIYYKGKFIDYGGRNCKECIDSFLTYAKKKREA